MVFSGFRTPVVRSWCSCGAKPYPSPALLEEQRCPIVAHMGADESTMFVDVLLMFVVDQSSHEGCFDGFVWTCHHIFSFCKRDVVKPNNKPSPNSPEMDGINPPKIEGFLLCCTIAWGFDLKDTVISVAA